jgi:uncharacterized protein RhaS with RHS repeats
MCNKRGRRPLLVYYYHSDALSSTRSLTDSGGNLANSYTYDAFGKIKNKNGDVTNEHTFTGRQLDEETGLYYYRARELKGTVLFNS